MQCTQLNAHCCAADELASCQFKTPHCFNARARRLSALHPASQPQPLVLLDLQERLRSALHAASCISKGCQKGTALQSADASAGWLATPGSMAVDRTCNAVLLWSQLQTPCGAAVCTGAPAGLTCEGVGAQTPGISSSIGAALHYLDVRLCPAPSAHGRLCASLNLAASLQHRLRLQLHVSSSVAGTAAFSPTATWMPHGWPRQAWLPRWHFDMLGDRVRNEAYDRAIRCFRATAAGAGHCTGRRTRLCAAVACLGALAKDGGRGLIRIAMRPAQRRRAVAVLRRDHSSVHVLDVGTGSGLLALMSAR